MGRVRGGDSSARGRSRPGRLERGAPFFPTERNKRSGRRGRRSMRVCIQPGGGGSGAIRRSEGSIFFHPRDQNFPFFACTPPPRIRERRSGKGIAEREERPIRGIHRAARRSRSGRRVIKSRLWKSSYRNFGPARPRVSPISLNGRI